MGTGLEVMDAMALLPLKIKSLTVPFLVMHGTADRATSVEGSKYLFDYALSADKSIRLYDDLQHIIFHEKPDSVLDIISWIHERI